MSQERVPPPCKHFLWKITTDSVGGHVSIPKLRNEGGSQRTRTFRGGYRRGQAQRGMPFVPGRSAIQAYPPPSSAEATRDAMTALPGSLPLGKVKSVTTVRGFEFTLYHDVSQVLAPVPPTDIDHLISLTKAHCGRSGGQSRRLACQISIASVPATIRASPKPERRVSLSWNTRPEKATVTRMLSLSMGATTLAGPSCRAR